MEIGDIFLLASERSERDTLNRSSMENAIRIYIYIYIAHCQVVVKFYRDLYFGYSPTYRSCGD